MTILKNVLHEVLGTDISVTKYVSGFIFTGLGFIIKRSTKVVGALKDTTNGSPNKWSFSYFCKDNIRKINSFFTSVVIIFICFRLSNDLFNLSFNYGLAIAVGYFYDALDDKIKNGELTIFKSFKSNL